MQQLPPPQRDPLSRLIAWLAGALWMIAMTVFFVLVVLPGMLLLGLIGLGVLLVLGFAGTIYLLVMRRKWRRQFDEIRHRMANMGTWDPTAPRPRRHVDSRVVEPEEDDNQQPPRRPEKP